MIIHSIGIKHDPSVVVFLFIFILLISFWRKNEPGKALAKLNRVSCQKTRASRTVFISNINHCPLPFIIVRCNKPEQIPCAKINLYSCSFVLCDAVMRVKVLLRGPFTDLAIGAIPVHSLRGSSSGKLWQLFAILNLLFCYKKSKNGHIIVCQSAMNLFLFFLNKQKKVQC